ncbi:MAG TPA: MFS transporter [Candidatus Micrarchaeia archaeon]|nr:MFS transporter [Candidatus Micrarchaeia archaeon]
MTGPLPRHAEPTSPALGLAVVMVGVVIAAVDTTIVILALPEIERSLHVPLGSVIWVVIGYLLVLTLLTTQVGRLGDMFGRVRMYEAGFLVFVVGSLLCGLAWSELAIIAARVVQGVGGALIAANSSAVIAEIFPPERRGQAFGFTAIGWNIGAVLGIVLGGIIVTAFSWRWVFLINLPIGLAALAVAVPVLHDRGERRPQRLDPLGMATLGAGLFAILWAMIELASAPLSGPIVAAIALGLLLVGAFVWLERRQPQPMLDLSLFRVPTLSTSMLASLFQALGSFAVLFLLLMYLQGARRLSPLDASLLLVPGYVIGGALSPVMGRLVDRIGPAVPATLGLAVQVVALILYGQLQLGTPLWVAVVATIVNGIGAASFFPANNAAVMKVAPPGAYGVASGLLRTFANVGMIFSFSLAVLIASRSIPTRVAFAIFVGAHSLRAAEAAVFTHGLHMAFYASTVLLAVAALFSAARLIRPLPATAVASPGAPPPAQQGAPATAAPTLRR